MTVQAFVCVSPSVLHTHTAAKTPELGICVGKKKAIGLRCTDNSPTATNTSGEMIFSYSHANPLLDRINNSEYFSARAAAQHHPVAKQSRSPAHYNLFLADGDMTSPPLQSARSALGGMGKDSSSNYFVAEARGEPMEQPPPHRAHPQSKRKKSAKTRRRSKSAAKRRKSSSPKQPQANHMTSCFPVYSTLKPGLTAGVSGQPPPIAVRQNGKLQRHVTASGFSPVRSTRDKQQQNCLPAGLRALPPSVPGSAHPSTRASTALKLLHSSLPLKPSKPAGTDDPVNASRRQSVSSTFPAVASRRQPTRTSFDHVRKSPGRASVKVEDAAQKPRVNGTDIQKAAANNLGSRLTLIHHYGNDYRHVMEKREKEQMQQHALRCYQEREKRKEENEKIKQEQRRKIYALNRLMTSLEMEKFKQHFGLA